MTNRERALAVLRYQKYDRMPIVHFGYWGETLAKWIKEGHIKQEELQGYGEGNEVDQRLNAKIGFDFDWQNMFFSHFGLRPGFEGKVIKEFPDGSKHVLGGDGVVYLSKPEAGSIPAHVDYTLKDRKAWEEQYKWRFAWTEERVNKAGLEWVKNNPNLENPLGLFCGSLYGDIRTILTVEGSCYLLADDEELFTEIIDTVGDLAYRIVKASLESGAKFDFAHFWEDICFKSGPLISPRVFREKVGPHYKRITDLTRSYGIEICSLDCDGMIDALIPTWVENGVNTMFPIEVGTWDANIAPWREKFGRELRGVGGVNKNVFGRDRAAVDAEIERIKPLVALGGYIPCFDHRLPPEAKWDLLRYYCDRMHQVFG